MRELSGWQKLVYGELENEVRTPEIRKLEGGTGLWREEEEAAKVILAISDHRGSPGEDVGRQHPEARTPQPSAPSTEPGCGEVLEE